MSFTNTRVASRAGVILLLGRRRSGSGTLDKPGFLAVLDPSSRLFLRGLLALVVWFPALTEEADSGQLGDRVEEEEAEAPRSLGW